MICGTLKSAQKRFPNQLDIKELDKDRRRKIDRDLFFDKPVKGAPSFGTKSLKSSDETAAPGLFGPESMPSLKRPSGDISGGSDKGQNWKSKSEAKVYDDYGFLERNW